LAFTQVYKISKSSAVKHRNETNAGSEEDPEAETTGNGKHVGGRKAQHGARGKAREDEVLILLIIDGSS
jgi:hypothetical protein